MAVRAPIFDAVGRFAEIRRGADTLWVQQAVRRFSPRAVGFAPDAVVHHMEMTSLVREYHKKWLYGRSSGRYRRATNRPFSTRDRMQIYHQTVAAQRYGWAQASTLLLLLTAAGLCYDLAARWPGFAPRRPSFAPDSGTGAG